ncbi:MAG: NUDIX hydrolase [Clostridia bacterium]|nr:NUDIX hydrolase [Clostridia bacterium]
MLFEKRIDGEVKYSGKIVTVVKDKIELPDGNTSYREVVRKNGGVCVVALTDNNEVVFVNQFRYPYGKVLKEIPAGKLEKNEDPLECGIRELSEETGYTAGKIIPLGEFYPSCGIMDEVLYMYLATDLKLGKVHLDEGEFLTSEKIPLDDAVQMILNGELADGKTQIAILKTWALKQKGAI